MMVGASLNRSQTQSGVHIGRRSILLGAASLAISSLNGRMSAAHVSGLRTVTLDYGIAQTLIELGHPPAAVASAHAWGKWVVEPRLPAETVNLGLTREINLEVLQQLKPDVIFSTPYLERMRPKLERIAPVRSLAIHATGGPALPPIISGTREIAAVLQMERQGDLLIENTLEVINSLRSKQGILRDRPLLLVNFLDPRHLRVYGQNSLFDAVLQLMGLENAWTEGTNSWGFSTIGIDQLSSFGDARLVYFEPIPPDAVRALTESPIWQAFDFVRKGRIHRLPPVLAFGMLPAATRFARLLKELHRG